MRGAFFTIGIFLSFVLFGQDNEHREKLHGIWEAGLPFITQYTTDDYKAAAQNWCFIQDDNGIMYVGNSSGILEFDGISWRLLKSLKGSTRINSFAKRNDGRIFVGASRDLGYLMPDSSGQMQFYSLLPQLDTTFHKFSDIWHTYAVRDTIYFITEKYIFRWANNLFKIIFPKKIFGFGFLVKENIYVDDRGTGLMRIDGDSTILIPDGFMFNKGGVTAMHSYGQNDIMIIHVLEGAFLYDQDKIVPFKNKLIKDDGTYGSTSLPNGDILIYSIGGGAYILDREGNCKLRLTKKSGLTSNVIYGAYVDGDGGLWLASDNGINRVEISSALRLYNDLNGFTEGAQNILYSSNGLYASTNDGLYHFSQKDLGFKRVEGIGNITRHLIQIDENILAGNMDALYRIDHENKSYVIRHKNKRDSYNILFQSKVDSTRVYVAGNSGNVYELGLTDEDWQLGESIFSVDGKIGQIVENSDTSWWISTRYNGVFKVDWSKNKAGQILKKNYKIKHFNVEDGLPGLNSIYLCPVDNKLYASTEMGVYLFDNSRQRFKPDSSIMDQIGLKNVSTGPMVSSKDEIWIAVKSDFQNKIYGFKNKLTKEVIPLRRFSNFIVYNIYDSAGDIIFFSGPKGIIAYNQRVDQNIKLSYPIQLRRVLLKNDSLLIANHFSTQPGNHPVQLPFQENNLRFVFALPSYDKPESNQYQYFLEGYDKGWSSWTLETQKDFTNLPEGDYNFRIRGQNVYGQMSDEAVYSFTILPPWYRTWWAYISYGLVLLGFVGLIVRWRSSQLRREKEKLEVIVEKRTHEIAKKNLRLKEQADQLSSQAEHLKEMDQIKSRFFANISHEFRTPITLIKGPINDLLKKKEEKLPLEKAEMIDRNAGRLQRLVNQLLDLSKLDAGSLELENKKGDLNSFLRALCSAFSSHAEQREMDYQISIPSKVLEVSFDHDKVEKIIYNLLSNAFKYTPDQGKVEFRAIEDKDQLVIKVSDNGRGIPEDLLQNIFERFFQVDSSTTREQEGTGIGLALTKELVTLMQGRIQVESKVGKGTTFIITFPISAFSKGMRITKTIAAVEAGGYDRFHDKMEKSAVQSDLDPQAPLILIVEDNSDMRSYISDYLKNTYRVLEAMHGLAGLEIAVKEIPDLVITDLMMPQMDGSSLCERLKLDERTSHIPVIMLTAKAQRDDKIEGLKIGADDYLTKPFDGQELLVRVDNLIQQREQLRERFSKQMTLQPKGVVITSLDEQFLQKLQGLIEQNLSDGSFGSPEMQRAMAMSKTQLHRKMKALTNEAPGEFLKNYRLKRAVQILAKQGDSITQIAYTVGFNSPSHFTSSFKDLYGISPSEYVKREKSK